MAPSWSWWSSSSGWSSSGWSAGQLRDGPLGRCRDDDSSLLLFGRSCLSLCLGHATTPPLRLLPPSSYSQRARLLVRLPRRILLPPLSLRATFAAQVRACAHKLLPSVRRVERIVVFRSLSRAVQHKSVAQRSHTRTKETNARPQITRALGVPAVPSCRALYSCRGAR